MVGTLFFASALLKPPPPNTTGLRTLCLVDAPDGYCIGFLPGRGRRTGGGLGGLVCSRKGEGGYISRRASAGGGGLILGGGGEGI